MSHPQSPVEPSVSPTTTAQTNPTVAEFCLPATGFALAEFFERVPNARIECEPTVANPEDHALLVTDTDECREDVERVLEASSDITAFERFGGNDDQCRYRVTWHGQPRQLIHEIVKRDVSIVSLLGESGQWKLRLRATERTKITNVDTIMKQFSCEAECLSISCWDADSTTDQHQLTTEQREALTEASKAGYYEIPRSATSSEVAEILGISHQALSERLRRAHRQLVDTHLRTDRGSTTHERVNR